MLKLIKFPFQWYIVYREFKKISVHLTSLKNVHSCLITYFFAFLFRWNVPGEIKINNTNEWVVYSLFITFTVYFLKFCSSISSYFSSCVLSDILHLVAVILDETVKLTMPCCFCSTSTMFLSDMCLFDNCCFWHYSALVLP